MLANGNHIYTRTVGALSATSTVDPDLNAIPYPTS